MATAKLFWSGRSQAVRPPKDFRFVGKEVRIRRHGSAVILKPIADDWSWLEAIGGQLDEDFAHAVIAMLRERSPAGSARATGETRRCRDLGPPAFLWRVQERKGEP
jgi:antitoxin VapB